MLKVRYVYVGILHLLTKGTRKEIGPLNAGADEKSLRRCHFGSGMHARKARALLLEMDR